MPEQSKGRAANGASSIYQAKDGGWHSQTYGQLKGGAALTTFVLDALSHAATEWRKKQSESIARGYEFLKAGFALKEMVLIESTFDNRKFNVFRPDVRGRTDRFVAVFEKAV